MEPLPPILDTDPLDETNPDSVLTRARRFEAIVESSDDAIIAKSLDGIVTFWNPAAERLFGYRAHEIVGKPISVLMPIERHEDMESILGRIRQGERVEHYETVRVAKDGRRIPVSLSVSPVKDASGRIVGATTALRIISLLGVRTRARSPSWMPRRSAAWGWTSTQGSGACEFKKPRRRVWLPLR